MARALIGAIVRVRERACVCACVRVRARSCAHARKHAYAQICVRARGCVREQGGATERSVCVHERGACACARAAAPARTYAREYWSACLCETHVCVCGSMCVVV
eukprot:6177813-Pleurochrysis_carterae.AAC.1